MDRVAALAAKQGGLISTRDVERRGISRNILYRMLQQGKLTRIGRGFYSLPETTTTEHLSMVEVSKQTPGAIICLISALSFHGLTTQIPHVVWIAVERARWHPRLRYPPLDVAHVSGEAFSFGIESHSISGIMVPIYSPAKTVADCFKFRNKVGLDVALEALRETRISRKATVDELMRAAEVCRVYKIMRPYVEAMWA
jgi:predicted transcriptional regulator of viral defense system